MSERTPTRRAFLAGTGLMLVAGVAGCSGLLGVSNVATRHNVGSTPSVTAGTDLVDAVIGLRKHPRIIASYSGVYEQWTTELMLAHIESMLLSAEGQHSN